MRSKKKATHRNNNNNVLQDGKERKDNAVEPGQASCWAYLRELKKVVDAADVLLQVLDASRSYGLSNLADYGKHDPQ
jgi:ribosome biogenesis GTPase A